MIPNYPAGRPPLTPVQANLMTANYLSTKPDRLMLVGAQRRMLSARFHRGAGQLNPPTDPGVVSAKPGDVFMVRTADPTSGLNLRASPSEFASVVTMIPYGDLVTATGPVSSGWMPVNYNGQIGYVAAFYLASSAGGGSVTPVSATTPIATTPPAGSSLAGVTTTPTVMGPAPAGPGMPLLAGGIGAVIGYFGAAYTKKKYAIPGAVVGALLGYFVVGKAKTASPSNASGYGAGALIGVPKVRTRNY